MSEYEDFLVTEHKSIATNCNSSCKCNYCGKDILLMPFTMNDVEFCDVLCAKLYAIEHQWKEFRFDKQEYDSYCKNDLISPQANIAYKILQKIDFALLPTIVELNEDRTINKDQYSATVINYINQVL